MRKIDLKKKALDWCEQLLVCPDAPPPVLEGVNDTVDNNNAIRGYAATFLIDAGYARKTVMDVIFKEGVRRGY